jgi:hypothetical protein
MPKISEDIIRAIEDAAKIEEVVGDFVTLRRAGVNMTGICPFHDDKHDGNFIVRPSRISEKSHGNTYRCFVCDAKGGPVQFLMNAEKMLFPDAIRWLGKKYNIPVDDAPINWTPPPPKPVPPPPPELEMPKEWVRDLMRADYNRNIFTYWFALLPWNSEQRQRIKQTLWEYCVGCWNDGRVVFWMIDHEGVPRAAKLMRFQHDERRWIFRDKTEHPGWLYNQEGYRQVCKPDEHTILKPLFGSHLLKRYPNAAVNVVESEKTALIMANYYGCPERQLWLACGGLKFLQLESMQPLIEQGRTVWLWPDKDGVSDWQKLADKLGSDKVNIYTRFFDTCWTEEDGDKADAADIAIRMMRQPEFVPRTKEAVTTHGGDTETHCNPLSPEQQDMLGIHEWALAHPDEPFIDPIELRDQRVHEWREILRQRYNFNKSK